MKLYYIISYCLSLAIVLLLIPVVRKISLKIGFVDMPSARKIHINPIPLGGGVGVYLAFLFIAIPALLYFDIGDEYPLVGLIAGVSLIIIIGVYDDYFDMDVFLKMLGQFIAAVIFLAFIKEVSPVMSFSVYPVFAAIWIVSLQNALNFLDNMDGLCGGLSMMIGAGLGILFVLKGMPVYAIISFAIAGAATGFLRYNLSPASIFLGDAGSLFFGFTLSCLSIIHLNTSETLSDALAPVLIMAYPIFDLTFVVITRLNEGRKVYIGGKDHSSHKISFLGFTKKNTVFLIFIINSLLVASGISIYFLIESPYRLLLVTVFALTLAFVGSHLYRNILYLKYRIGALFADIASFNLAFLLYFIIKYKSDFLGFSTFIQPFELAVPLIWINIFWLIIHSALASYDLPIESGFRRIALAIIKSVFIGASVFMILNINPDMQLTLSLKSVGTYIGLLLGINIILRYLYYQLVNKLIIDRKQMRMIVVNLDSDSISENDLVDFSGYEIVGFLGRFADSKLEYLGELDDIIKVLKQKKIARIAIYFNNPDAPELTEILKMVFFMETQFVIRSKNAGYLKGMKLYPTTLKNVMIVSGRMYGFFGRLYSRILASTISLLILLIFSPIFIYKLICSHINNKQFMTSCEIEGIFRKKVKCHCFGESVNSNNGIPKIKLGLPSLLSVIKGELSFVGKVPLTYRQAEADSERFDGYWRRDLIKPGIWGPAHFADKENYFEEELKYMANMSILKDIYHVIIGLVRSLPAMGKKDNVRS